MSLSNSPFWFASGASSADSDPNVYPYSLNQSLRLFEGGLKKLDTSTSGNGKTYTLSAWFKLADLNNDGSALNLFGAGAGTDATFVFRVRDNGTFQFSSRYVNTNGANFQWSRRSTKVLRDISAWYHVCINVDTTFQGATTKFDYFTVWLNGEDITTNFTYVNNTEESVAATYDDPTRWNIASSQEQTVGYYEGNGTAGS